MPTLPAAMIVALAPFAPLFSPRVWGHVQVLLAGAILAPTQRTVTAALRVRGLGQAPQFHRYHRVLSRAQWFGLAVSQVRLRLLVATFAPEGSLVFGIDEPLERRRGKKIAPKGIDRDPVRSSHAHFVKASGLRWVGLRLLVPIPWAARVWALPALTALAPAARYDQERGRRHKPLTDWARPARRLARRWWPDRPLVAVADRRDAALEFLAAGRAGRHPVTGVTRLRLDAALDEPAPPRRPGQTGRPRLKGPRRPTRAGVAAAPATPWAPITVAQWYGSGERTVEVASATAVWSHTGLPPVALRWVLVRDPRGAFPPQAPLCTDLTVEPAQIPAWFGLRWRREVTCEEARRQLGVETQRQWSDLALRRTTPALLGLFSAATLLAHQRRRGQMPDSGRQSAWYRKPPPTFAKAFALGRRERWAHGAFCLSARAPDMVKVPRAFVEHLTDMLCCAA